MDYRLPRSDRGRSAGRLTSACARALLGCLVALSVAGPARAHPPSRMNSREIVRISGWFGVPPKGATIVRKIPLTVQGRQRELNAVDWQVFGLVTEQTETLAPEPPQLTLQGTREQLARIAEARGEQRVSILAERRPGVGELFVLALDLCPSE